MTFAGPVQCGSLDGEEKKVRRMRMRSRVGVFVLGLLVGFAPSLKAEWSWGDLDVLQKIERNLGQIATNLGQINGELRKTNTMLASGCSLEKR